MADEVVCPKCRGAKTVLGGDGLDIWDCPLCNGTGKVSLFIDGYFTDQINAGRRPNYSLRPPSLLPHEPYRGLRPNLHDWTDCCEYMDRLEALVARLRNDLATIADSDWDDVDPDDGMPMDPERNMRTFARKAAVT